MQRRRPELPLLAAVFLDLLGFGMVIADFQLRAEHLVPKGWPAGPVIGALLGSTFVIQLLVSPRWGRLSDHRGRKPVVLICTLLSAAAMVVYGLADSIGWLLLSRVLAGLGSANVAVAQALISDETEGEARTAALGRISAAIGAGLVLGPPLGGFLATRGGNLAIGLTAGVASLLGAAWLAVVLPSVPPKTVQEPGRRPPIDLTLLRDLPRLRPLVTIAVVAWFSLATLEGTFARLINHLFGYTQKEFGLLFGYEALLGIIVSARILGWVASRVRETPLLRGAYLAQGLGLALNPLAAAIAVAVPPLGTLFVASTLYAAGAGLANPTVNALCSKLTPDDRQGELFGLLQGTRAVGFVLGPIVGGWMFDWNPTAPYLLAGAVCVVAAVLVPRIE
ncbi:MAG: MFS transporter [Fimbriimonas sp.]